MITRASTRARWGSAAAVVVAAVVVGAAVLGNGRADSGVGAGSATPSPSLTPSFTPSPTPAPPTSLSGAPQATCPGSTAKCIQPGTYGLTSSVWPATITFDVPAGWFEWSAASDFDGVLVDSGPDAPDGSGWGLMFATVGVVSKDPCDPGKGTVDPATTTTVDGIVKAMRAWPGFTATAPARIVVGGYNGQLVELSSTLKPAACPNPVLWTTKHSATIDAYPLVTKDSVPHKVQYRILDVDGTPLVIRTTDFPETSPNEAEQGVGRDPTRHGQDQVELHEILNSIRVTPTTP